MKLLTIIISSDLEDELDHLLAGKDVDCYVKLTEAYGISHSCEGMVGENMPWEATVFLVSGEQSALEQIAETIREKVNAKDYKPCLRMMIQAIDKVWI